MERVVNTIKFINDILSLAYTIEKTNKDLIRINVFFDIKYYCISLNKLVRMDCFISKFDSLVEICYKPINHNKYYIFYDLMKEDFIFLKGKEIKHFEIEKFEKKSLIEIFEQNKNFILGIVYIKNMLKKIPSLLNKLNYFELETIAQFTVENYNRFKESIQAKNDNHKILLQTSYFIGNEDFKIVYQRDYDKHLLISIELVVLQDYDDFTFRNDEELIAKYTDYIKKQVINIANDYNLLSLSNYFHIYQYNSINEDGATISFINIDFEFDELVKLLFFIDTMEIIDKI